MDKIEQLQSLSIDRTTAGPPPRPQWPMLLLASFLCALMVLITWWVMHEKINQANAKTQSALAQLAKQQKSKHTGGNVRRAAGMIASGYVTARRKATVSAEISGTIRAILFEEGTRVEKGQVLARLDDERAQIALRQVIAREQSAKRNIQSINAQIAEAKIVFTRAQTLANKGIGAKAAVSASKASLDTLAARRSGAKADWAAAQANVASQRDLVARHVVRAPFAGVVIAKNAQVGEILSPSSAGGGFTRTGIATMVDMQSLEIEVDVNEGQIGRVSAGQKVEAILDAYADWRMSARVIAIIPTADRARATIKVRIAFDTLDDRILPDMAAKVTFIEE